MICSLGVSVLAVGLSGCGNETARAPNPTSYDWPDAFGYRLESAALVVARDTEVVSRYAESKELKFAVRNDQFLVWHEDLRQTNTARGIASSVRPQPEDTVRYFLRLSRWGEFLALVPDCDPAVTACHDVLLSALPLELRHIIPKLPVWWPPKGHEWDDTLAFDDLPRPRGERGSVVARYRAARDTVIGAHGYWIVTWRAMRRAVGSAAGGLLAATPPVEEFGSVYVDKQLLIPVYARWFGSAAVSQRGSAGGTGTRFRGSAVLIGSAIDSARTAEEAQ